MNPPHILIVDDEESLRFTFENFLLDEGYRVSTANSFNEALETLSENHFDLVVSDILLEDGTGIDLLREIKNKKLTCPVVMVTGFPNLETATEAVRLGAYDYLSKPVKQEDLTHVTRLALKQKKLIEEREKYRSHLETIFRCVKDGIIAVDTDLRITAINRAAAEIFSPAKDPEGESFRTLAASCLPSCLELLDNTINEKSFHELARTSWQPEGHDEKILTLTASPLMQPDSTLLGAVLIIRDETRLATLETDLLERQQFCKIIGKSKKMQEIYALLENLANVQSTVLVTGETGTGKELVADALHYSSESKNKKFVKINCSALPENLLESELFGHVRGAFTGAIKDKVGRFEKANNGTIFLDEIGDISPGLQLRLLRVLQEKEFERVGDSKTIKVSVRVIAATNHDLKQKVAEGTFREDLYYRLNVVEVHLPPLRERREDIPLLVDHFLHKHKEAFKKEITAVTDEVLSLFMSYDWPGNIRELEHAIEHGFVICQGSLIGLNHLPRELKEHSLRSSPIQEEQHTDPYDQSAELKRIKEAIAKAGGNKAKAARLLGFSRQTIYRKIKEFSIKTDDM